MNDENKKGIDSQVIFTKDGNLRYSYFLPVNPLEVLTKYVNFECGKVFSLLCSFVVFHILSYFSEIPLVLPRYIIIPEKEYNYSMLYPFEQVK